MTEVSTILKHDDMVRSFPDFEETVLPDDECYPILIISLLSVAVFTGTGIATEEGLLAFASALSTFTFLGGGFYHLSSLGQVKYMLKERNLPAKSLLRKTFFKKKVSIHAHKSIAPYSNNGKPEIIGENLYYGSKTHQHNTSVVWTWRGFGIEQTSKPTAQTMWDRSLESAVKIYSK